MTTLTPDALDGLQRFATITEFERTVFKEIPYRNVAAGTLADLVRLARLGLRVEGAPTCSLTDVNHTVEGLHQFADTIASLDGKRVALVVLE